MKKNYSRAYWTYTAWLKRLFSRPGFFMRYRLKNEAKRQGLDKLSNNDLNELLPDADTRSQYMQLIIKAHKAGVIKPENVISDFFKIRKTNKDFIKQLVNPMIKAKKAGLDIDPEDIKKLYKEKKNIPKITQALINADQNDFNLKINDVKTIFYNKRDFGKKIVSLYIKSKKEYAELTSTQFKNLIFQNIDPEEFLNVLKMLNERDLHIPFSKLSKLLVNRINIIKTIIILSKAKQSCVQELKKHDLFSDKENKRLADIYVTEGKEKFKKELSKSLLSAQQAKDPVNLYYRLTRSEGKGFKVNLETINDYLGYEYEADINKVTGSYLKARKNNLHIKYKQLAVLAQQKVDVEKFIEAQIKSGADE